MREVADSTRTSTLTGRWPPMRVWLWSVSTRRILACVVGGMSAISSRNRVPPCACSSRPGRGTPSTSLPNNSSSTRSGLIIAAETTMNGALARGLQLWIIRAAISLPTPAGPVISTRLPVGATRLIVARTVLIATELPDKLVVGADLLAQRRILAPQPVGLGRARHEVEQFVGLERLFDEVDRALADRRDRGVEIAVARDHQHRQRRVAALDLLEQLQPVEPRALQPDVEQDEARAAVLDRVERASCCRPRCAPHSLRPRARPATSSRMSASSSTTNISSAISLFPRDIRRRRGRSPARGSPPRRRRAPRAARHRTRCGRAFRRPAGRERQSRQDVPRRSS